MVGMIGRDAWAEHRGLTVDDAVRLRVASLLYERNLLDLAMRAWTRATARQLRHPTPPPLEQQATPPPDTAAADDV